MGQELNLGAHLVFLKWIPVSETEGGGSKLSKSSDKNTYIPSPAISEMRWLAVSNLAISEMKMSRAHCNRSEVTHKDESHDLINVKTS